MKRLTANLITRGRPKLLLETVKLTMPHMSLPDSTLMISVDKDDQPTLDSLKLLPKDSRIVVSCKDREDSRGEKYDRALTECPADLYLLMTDHGACLTPGFDEKILEAGSIWPDGIGVVYTQMCDELVPMLQCPTAKYASKMGYLYNHDYPYWFIDHEMADIAWAIGRINFADVRVDQGRRPKTTTRLRDLKFWASYYEFTVLERRAKIREIVMSPDFQAPDWLKKQLCNWTPLVESRSRHRNMRVIHGAEACERERGESSPPDEGYLRAKAKAERKMSELYSAYKNTALRAAA